MKSKYFSEKEIKCKCGCGKSDISTILIKKLDQARALAGIPFVITSGIRCEEHNEKEGGAKTSSHITGYAVDIKATTSAQRSAILKAVHEVGFNRIGIAKSFIHVDVDPTKSPNVCWMY